jgi:integrase
MKSNGKSDYSIQFVDKTLTHLSQHADLSNPESVKQFIASKDVSNGYKKNLCLAYDKYCNYYGTKWTMPSYKPQPKAIRVPTKTQIESLIANARPTISLMLTVSKETGLRPIELCNLKVRDIDFEQRFIYPATAKHGNPRKLKISTNLKVALQKHINKRNLNPKDQLFNASPYNYGKRYRQMRNNLAEKLSKPELRTIRLYDFRHYFATMLYAKTRDILLVKQKLGHRKIENTLIYTQLINLNDDEWTCRASTSVKESTALIEAGFEYVTDQDGLRLFRKRK